MIEAREVVSETPNDLQHPRMYEGATYLLGGIAVLAAIVMAVLVLKAQCRQDRQRTWRCTQYVARLVDRDSVDVRASAVLNPLVKPAKPLKKISEAVTVGWFVGGGA